MPITGVLVAAGTATTNPAPSTLSPTSPFPTPYVDRTTVSSAWTTQAKPALFPVNTQRSVREPLASLTLNFVPSSGAAVTYTVTMWTYNRIAGAWVQPKDYGSFSLTGNVTTAIADPGDEPIFLQLSSISAGTIAIYFDSSVAGAA